MPLYYPPDESDMSELDETPDIPEIPENRRCAVCGLYTGYEADGLNILICDGCLDRDYFVCDFGEFHRSGHGIYVRNDMRCPECERNEYGELPLAFVQMSDSNQEARTRGNRPYNASTVPSEYCCVGCSRMTHNAYEWARENGFEWITRDEARRNDFTLTGVVRPSPRGTIHPYSYKPNPLFFGEGPTYLGMELEVGVPNRSKSEAADLVSDRVGQLAYMKYDGSVDGFEIVSHPMSYPYALSDFPWQMLSELDSLGCYDSDDYGLHVHVSRAGFAGPMHIYRWMKFFYRNQHNVTRIARRSSSGWASFGGEMRPNIKFAAKGVRREIQVGLSEPFQTERYNYDRNRYERVTVREPITWYPERYSAINVQNEATFEVRVFRSSLEQSHIQSALGLVAGSVEYTRNLSASDILHNKGWEWQSFRSWLDTQNGIYSALSAESDELCAS